MIDVMNITRITLILSCGMDKILFYTDLPPASYGDKQGSVFLQMYAGRGIGEQYIKENFPNTPYEIIRDSRPC